MSHRPRLQLRSLHCGEGVEADVLVPHANLGEVCLAWVKLDEVQVAGAQVRHLLRQPDLDTVHLVLLEAHENLKLA